VQSLCRALYLFPASTAEGFFEVGLAEGAKGVGIITRSKRKIPLSCLTYSLLFALFAFGRTSESIEIPMPRLRLSDQRRSEWGEINRLEA
jgi:hypothetical protein